MGITDRRHFHAQQFQFGAHVRATEHVFASSQPIGQDTRHLVARCHQAENLPVPQGAFTDGINRLVAGAALAINHNTAACPHLQFGSTGKLITRTDTGGK
ncbi:hypothetical protein D3C81_936040 [compost metagenome]